MESGGVLAVPIHQGSRILAVIEVLSDNSEAPDKDLLEQLQISADQLGPFVQGQRAEVALRESESKYRKLVDLSPNAFVVLIDSTIASVNAAGARLFGASTAEDLVSKPILDFVHAEDRPAVEARLKQLEAGGDLRLTETRLRRRDGSSVAVEVAASTCTYGGKPAVQAIIRDISERESADAALMDSNEQFRMLVEGVEVYMVMLLDPLGNVRGWNAGAERLMGYSSEEIIGVTVTRLFPQEAVEGGVIREALETARRDGQCRLKQIQQVRKDGSRFWTEIYFTELKDRAGRPRGFSTLTRDISERKQAEQELATQMCEIARSNEELQQFAFCASHDLQEPLRKVLAFGDRLKDKYKDALGAGGLDYLDRMQAAAGRMQNLINNLLAYSRVTTQAQPFTEVDLNCVVREVLSDLELRIEKEHSKIRLEKLPRIEADSVQMHQLFQNLISNALKFRKPNIPAEIEIGVRVEGRICQLTVKDKGIGFDQKYAERIFTLLQRLHGLKEYEGTGIGLAICKKIVERHGGSVRADSAPDQGATFTVTLPLKQERRLRDT